METIFVKPKDIVRQWFIIDATNKTLGHVAAKAAYVLRGKHKPLYAPHQECGDYVIVVNADKVVVTGRKAERKLYYYHSRHPGGLRTFTFQAMIKRRPEYPLETAIRGMLPKTRLGRTLFTNLKVYAGEQHPHAAQKPQTLEV